MKHRRPKSVRAPKSVLFHAHDNGGSRVAAAPIISAVFRRDAICRHVPARLACVAFAEGRDLLNKQNLLRCETLVTNEDGVLYIIVRFVGAGLRPPQEMSVFVSRREVRRRDLCTPRRMMEGLCRRYESVLCQSHMH
ncbi:hypothetical protein EVAR_84133_1 [Eumeta japonica]|uniref:Uncharacterized protein n=1 Tax=Eumeta variegata TaxID=151549 RepID=A0A4C1V098_EUMVA|nr:hypothetical protein EVAR_84133_1 [Eumeta japonica]